MKTYTALEYLYIDLANQAGLNDISFEERIRIAKQLYNKTIILDKIKEPERFYACKCAIDDAYAGIPSGYGIGMDTSASVPQLISVLMGCVEGCRATGLINRDKPEDLYVITLDHMKNALGELKYSRNDVKYSQMPMLYNSTAAPIRTFGNPGTDDYEAFMDANWDIIPGAMTALSVMQKSWRSDVKAHQWYMPNGTFVSCPVLVKKDYKISCEEFGFDYIYRTTENTPAKEGKSNNANIIQSIDALAVSEVTSMAMYDIRKCKDILDWISIVKNNYVEPTKVHMLEQLYNRTNFFSYAIIDRLTIQNLGQFTLSYLLMVKEKVKYLIQNPPFDIRCIFDEFICLPSNVNRMRSYYNNFIHRLAKSTLLEDILSQIAGKPVVIEKLSANIANVIENSNYALH